MTPTHAGDREVKVKPPRTAHSMGKPAPRREEELNIITFSITAEKPLLTAPYTPTRSPIQGPSGLICLNSEIKLNLVPDIHSSFFVYQQR